MKLTTDKQLIISLIRDNLINTKLISGLNFLGLHADNYTLYLGDTIFKLMEFPSDEQSDWIFENVYMGNSEKVRSIDFSFCTDELDRLSNEIYNELLFAREAFSK